MKFYLSKEGIAREFENTIEGHEGLQSEVEGPNLALVLFVNGSDQDREFVQKNFQAVIMKAWKFLWPLEAAPANPWQFSREHPRISISSYPDQSVITVYLGSQMPDRPTQLPATTLRSVIWRLSNAFEWCNLPNRKQLSSNSAFSKETWNAISVYRREDTLKRITSTDSPSPDLEPAVSNPQSQTDAAE